jgi:DNA-binding transcriptional LysR family regulator
MTMHVTLRQLQAFVAVVRTGSFSEAAQAMHLSQAALSGLIRELEQRVGVRLLDRTTRSVSPSAVGEAFDPMVRRVLATLDEALASLSNLKELRRGVVRLAAPEPLSCTLLPELIAAYSTQHPGIDVRFDDVPIEQVLAELHEGSADIGFGPAGALRDEAIAAHALWADPLWVAVAADDPLAQAEAVRWRDLREVPIFNYMPNFAPNVLSHVPARNHPRKLAPVHRVNTALSMLQVTRGAVVCPEITQPLARGFGLAFLPLLQPQVNWQVAMFVRRGPAPSPAVESFMDHARAFTQGRGGR